MVRGRSRPRWQTVILVTVATGVITGLLYGFHQNTLVQGLLITILGAGLTLTAFREETRRRKLARLFVGPFITATALATIAGLDVALIPAVVFSVPSLYYVALDTIRRDPLGVRDDSTGSS